MNFKNLLVLTRGDDLIFNVSMQDKGASVPFSPGDEVCFTVKKSDLSEKNAIQKRVCEFDENGEAVFVINGSDTSELAPGSYVYDVQYTDSSGRTTTIIRPSCFQITKEVTHE